MQKLLKTMQPKIKALGIYQIVGGILGLLLTVWLISGLATITFSIIVLLLIAIALYLYSMYCGALLLRKNDSGLNFSLINQYLQLFGFSCFGFSFQYISGVSVVIGVDLTDTFLFTFNLGVSSWEITIGENHGLLLFKFNLVALFLILLIGKLKKELQKNELEKQLTSIGQ